MGQRHDQRVDQGKGRGEGIHEGGHVAFGVQADVRRGVQGREGAVSNGDKPRAPGVGEFHGLDGAAGIPGEGNADEQISLSDAGQLFENVADAGGDAGNVLKDKAQIMNEELGDGAGSPQTHYVNMPGLNDPVDGLFESVHVQLVQGGANVLHVRLQYLVQHLGVIHIAGHFKALRGGEPMANQFLQGLLQLRISGIAQRGGEAHHRGFGNAYVFAQPGGGHEHHLVVMGDDAFRDTPMTF